MPFNVFALRIIRRQFPTWPYLPETSYYPLTLCFVCLFSDGSGGGDPTPPYFKTKLKPEGPKTIWMTGPPPLPEGPDPPVFVCPFFSQLVTKKQPLRIATNCGSYHGRTIAFGFHSGQTSEICKS